MKRMTKKKEKKETTDFDQPEKKNTHTQWRKAIPDKMEVFYSLSEIFDFEVKRKYLKQTWKMLSEIENSPSKKEFLANKCL